MKQSESDKRFAFGVLYDQDEIPPQMSHQIDSAIILKPKTHDNSTQEDPTISRLALRKSIAEYFSKDDLKVFCFDEGIEFDDIEANTLKTTVIKLIQHLWKRGISISEQATKFNKWLNKEGRPSLKFKDLNE